MESKQWRNGQQVIIFTEMENGAPRIMRGTITGFITRGNPKRYILEVETADGYFWRDPDAVYNDLPDLIAAIPDLVA